MEFKKEIIILLIIVLVLLIFGGFLFFQKEKEIPKSILLGNAEVFVEIGDNTSEWEKGLMFRKSLGENSGMLFIFKDLQERSFWMKNTLIELDLIFIDEDLKIVNIQNAVPCEKEQCENYNSVFPAKYVLEVNSGFVEKNNILVGDVVEFKY